MTQFKNILNKSKVVGNINTKLLPLPPFDALSCEYLNNLSEELIKHNKSKYFPDILAFAFWIRRKNLERKKSQYKDLNTRLGKGILFHITPSNVAMNFAYSFAFGFLTGNLNVIRVPTKKYKQIEIFCEAVKKVSLNSFKPIKFFGVTLE